MQDFMNKPLIRTMLFFAVFAMLVVLPWWVSLPIILGLALYIPFYLEVLFWGFLFDTLYADRYAFPYFHMSIALAFFIIVVFIKDRIRT